LFPRKKTTTAAVYLVSIIRRRWTSAVTPEDRDRMIDLCKRIAREADPKRLAFLIDELNGIIQTKIRELRDARRAS
jgi:hypothetical protein